MILLQDHGDKHSLDIKLMDGIIHKIQLNGEEKSQLKQQQHNLLNKELQHIKSILELLSMVEDFKFQLHQNLAHIFQLLED